MKGTFKESEIEIIDLSRERKPLNQMNSFIAMADAARESFFEKEIVNTIVDEIHKRENEEVAKDLVAQNKAMKATIAFLEKCLDEATEDRDRYKAMWQANMRSRKEYRELYVDAKRQLDELNAKFEKRQIKVVGQSRYDKLPGGNTCLSCK